MRRRMQLAAALIALIWVAAAPAQETCGGAEAPCPVTGGSYHVALPEAPAGAPIVLYLHGYAASGTAAVEREALIAPFISRGMAVVAPNGQRLAEDGPRDWGVDDGYDWPRDDIAFLAAVLDDARGRFGLDDGPVLVAGYSRGGSMAWDLACAIPVAALASQSGAFWMPLPHTCAAAVPVHHTHGMADRTVPFEGRRMVFAGHPFHQGNVMAGLDIWRETNGCMSSATFTDADGLWTKRWDCDAEIVLTLGPFGHGRQAGWPEAVAAWFSTILDG